MNDDAIEVIEIIERKKHWLRRYLDQVVIALNQMCNAAVLPIFTWTIGWADETMSARAWRGRKNGKPAARILIRFVDALFGWQKPDVLLNGQPVKSHCERTYYKERAKRGTHPEYRESISPYPAATKGPQP